MRARFIALVFFVRALKREEKSHVLSAHFFSTFVKRKHMNKPAIILWLLRNFFPASITKERREGKKRRDFERLLLEQRNDSILLAFSGDVIFS